MRSSVVLLTAVFSSVLAIPQNSSPSTTASYGASTPTADACVTKCNANYDACRTAPSANQSFCAAQYSECLGYMPFNNGGSLVTPTACSSTASATSSATATSTADACVTKCNADYDTCRTAPNSNKSYCAAQYSGCLGYVPFNNEGSLVTPTACSSTASATSSAAATSTADACVAKCNADYDTCRTAPNSNKSYCAAQYSGCLGYVPFNNEGSLVTPTACSASATGGSSAAQTTSSAAQTTKSVAQATTSAAQSSGHVNGTVTTATTAGAPVKPTTSPIQANGASSIEGGFLGVFGLFAAALLL